MPAPANRTEAAPAEESAEATPAADSAAPASGGFKAWLPLIEAKGVSIEWRPQFVSITAGADVAMSHGPFVITRWDEAGQKSYLIGQFVSVWARRNASAPWRVMLDGGGPPPVAATEEEARRHLDAAPSACPRG